MNELRDLAGYYVLLFASTLILRGHLSVFTTFVSRLGEEEGFCLSTALLNSLTSGADPVDSSPELAFYLHHLSQERKNLRVFSPSKIFVVASHAMETAKITGYRQIFGPMILNWLIAQWQYIREHQRFLLWSPGVHETRVQELLEHTTYSWNKAVNLLLEILPMMDFKNKAEIARSLQSLLTNEEDE